MTEIEFFKPDGRRYRSVLHRRDGVVIELDGGGYNKLDTGVLPHDLAHFVVEDALGLEAGLWGVIAAGGMFGHTKVIAGRRPPHAAKRAQAVVDGAGDRLSQAEMLTRAVCDLALAGADGDFDRLRAATGERWWTPTVTADDVITACRRLRETSAAWRDLPPGDALRVQWRLQQTAITSTLTASRSAGAARGPARRVRRPVPRRPRRARSLWIGSVRTGGAGTPRSVSHAASCSLELTYTIRPRPTQPCAAAHIGQCSPDV